MSEAVSVDGRAAAAELVRGVIALRFAADRVSVAQGDVAQLAGNLRAAGVSWAVIGHACGISRQAAQQRFGGVK